MAHGDTQEKWRGNKRMEWVTSKRHMTAEHRLARAVQTLQADVHSSPASSKLTWRPRRLKWTRPLRRKTKSGFCACAVTFQTQSTADRSFGVYLQIMFRILWSTFFVPCTSLIDFLSQWWSHMRNNTGVGLQVNCMPQAINLHICKAVDCAVILTKSIIRSKCLYLA
jgi:hypothetical protein